MPAPRQCSLYMHMYYQNPPVSGLLSVNSTSEFCAARKEITAGSFYDIHSLIIKVTRLHFKLDANPFYVCSSASQNGK